MAPAPEPDPVSYVCSCSAQTRSGSVLLFYRYWANDPALLADLIPRTIDTKALAQWYEKQMSLLQLGGKIRIAREGFNVTVGGTTEAIKCFIEQCCRHWSFAGLHLYGDGNAQKTFFKPSAGCACVFGGNATVKAVAEATPMGVTSYEPADWRTVVSLSPEKFHTKCYQDNILLMDVRNHYESRIGHFVSPIGEPAVCPQVRRFSQWPQYVKAHAGELKSSMEGREVMAYCTGGIRCEKGVRFMQEHLLPGETVYTLKGGVAAYLDWMNEEIRAARKQASDSLFKGRNYVFDGRGSLGLDEGDLISTCHKCGQTSGRLGKCQLERCHLVLVVCEACEDKGNVWCCQDCRDIRDFTGAENHRPRPICACEKERESILWGGERAKNSKGQGWKKLKKQEKKGLDIRVKIINSEGILV